MDKKKARQTVGSSSNARPAQPQRRDTANTTSQLPARPDRREVPVARPPFARDDRQGFGDRRGAPADRPPYSRDGAPARGDRRDAPARPPFARDNEQRWGEQRGAGPRDPMPQQRDDHTRAAEPRPGWSDRPARPTDARNGGPRPYASAGGGWNDRARPNRPGSRARRRHEQEAQLVGYVDPYTLESRVPVREAIATDAPVSEAFVALGLSEATGKLLGAREITEPTPIQVMTIPVALEGRDLMGKAKTGSGKTFAFGLPMVERLAKGEPGRPAGLVLVPTRELATQVARELSDFAAARGLGIITVFGGVPLGGQVRGIRAGADILVATPGRLNDLIEREVVTMDGVQVAVVDEADQMADFGFMPQVERILDGLGETRQVLLFSATLDGEIARLTKKYQTDPVAFEAPVEIEEAPAIQHRFIGVDPVEKVAVAASIAAGPDRTIMFVRTQRAAERLSINLQREGVSNSTLHGGMSQGKRERALADFAAGRIPVLVATNIAARGIHVDDINIVVHHDPPEDFKTFVHRSGRTARAGASGIVVTLVEPAQARDISLLKRQAGIRESVVSMTPTDPRLADLAGWEPPHDADEPQRPQGQRRPYVPRGQGPRPPANRRTWQRRD